VLKNNRAESKKVYGLLFVVCGLLFVVGLRRFIVYSLWFMVFGCPEAVPLTNF
jgi:hypothetical protein